MAGFSPTRLQIARERCGFLRKELAARCDVSPQMLSYWEKGTRQPAERDIARLAAETDFPESFFYQEEIDRLPEGAVSFRARTRIPARHISSALAAAELARELARWIERRFKLPPVSLAEGLPDLIGQPPDLVARVVRTEWMLGDKPIPNMIHLLESRGVLVLSLAQDVHQLDAFSFWSEGRPIVLLNTMKTAERSRMDAAHELMHLLCHHERTDKKEEQEANQFASAFLMPESDVRAHFPTAQIAGLGNVMTAKRRWGVALTALVVRLHTLGLVSEWQYRTFFIELSKRGYRSKEPNGMPKRETSRIMSRVFDALTKQGTKSSDVAEKLGWPQAQLDELLFGLGATLMPLKGGRVSPRVPPDGKKKRDHLQLVRDAPGRKAK